MDVELQYFDSCPHWRAAEEHLREALRRTGHDEVTIRLNRLDAPQDADDRFRGSPTVLIDGRDLLPLPSQPTGMSCRVYRTPEGRSGAPTVEQLVRALTR